MVRLEVLVPSATSVVGASRVRPPPPRDKGPLWGLWSEFEPVEAVRVVESAGRPWFRPLSIG